MNVGDYACTAYGGLLGPAEQREFVLRYQGSQISQTDLTELEKRGVVLRPSSVIVSTTEKWQG